MTIEPVRKVISEQVTNIFKAAKTLLREEYLELAEYLSYLNQLYNIFTYNNLTGTQLLIFLFFIVDYFDSIKGFSGKSKSLLWIMRDSAKLLICSYLEDVYSTFFFVFCNMSTFFPLLKQNCQDRQFTNLGLTTIVQPVNFSNNR